MCTLHCVLYMYSVHCTMYTVKCALYIVYCTMCTVHRAAKVPDAVGNRAQNITDITLSVTRCVQEFTSLDSSPSRAAMFFLSVLSGDIPVYTISILFDICK